MARDPDISALAAYGGEFERALFSTLVNTLDALNDLTLISNIKNKLNLTKLTVASGARPYSSTFQAKGDDLKYTPRVLEVAMGKRDLSIEPYLYRPTWMSQVMRPGVNPDDIPFAQYVWNQVLTQLASEINNRTIYFGVDKADAAAYDNTKAYAKGDMMIYTGANGIPDYFRAVAATTAGDTPVSAAAKWEEINAESICIGFAKRIADAVTNDELTQVATGAIAAGTAYAQFTDVWRKLPVAYRKRGANIYASFDNVDLLIDDFEDKVGKFTERDTSIITLPKTGGMCKIIRATWMGDSGRLICTPAQNMLIGTDLASDMNRIRTKEELRYLDAGIDFVLGTQVRDLDAMVVNDQA